MTDVLFLIKRWHFEGLKNPHDPVFPLIPFPFLFHKYRFMFGLTGVLHLMDGRFPFLDDGDELIHYNYCKG